MRRKTPGNAQHVGKYKLLRLIAEGEMGQVYEAMHVELGRRAAVKLLRPDIAKNEDTATPPFIGEQATQLIGQHLFMSPPSLRTIHPDAEPMLDELLQRMLAKAPDGRPTMQGVINELGQIDRHLRSKASPVWTAEDSNEIETVVFSTQSLSRMEALKDS